MTDTASSIALCRYQIKPGKEQEFERVIANHLPKLRDAHLIADRPPYLLLRGRTEAGRTYYVEIVVWADEEASSRAHGDPEVMRVWGELGSLCDEMDFPHVEPFAKKMKNRFSYFCIFVIIMIFFFGSFFFRCLMS